METWADAQKCGDLLRSNRDRIDGILVCLPNFGDEKGIADSIRLADVRLPILVQACPDDLDQFGLNRRRDAFCGKISACNNLRQYGFKFSLTRDTYRCRPSTRQEDLLGFVRTCEVVSRFRRVRDGASGRASRSSTPTVSARSSSMRISSQLIDLGDLGRGWARFSAMIDPTRIERSIVAVAAAPASRWCA